MTDWYNMQLPYQLQWFAKDGPGGEKTEEPTSKRLTDARNDGKVAKSKELSGAFGWGSEIFKLVLPFFIIGFIVAFLGDLVQVRWKVTTKPMQPKLSKFNPLNGFKRILSKDSLFELLKLLEK